MSRNNDPGVLEEEVGGFQKNPWSNKKSSLQEERAGKNKTPRSKVPKTATTVMSVLSAVSPPEKKEGVIMENNKTVQSPHPCPCPICGFDKDADRFLVCRECGKEFEAYNDKIVEQILGGQKNITALSKSEWVLSMLNLPLFIEEHKKALQERANLNDWAIEKAKAEAHNNNSTLSPEALAKMVRKFEEKERPGRQEKVVRMWARLQAARTLKPELEQRLAETARARKAAEIVETPTPALTAEPAPATPTTLLVIAEPVAVVASCP